MTQKGADLKQHHTVQQEVDTNKRCVSFNQILALINPLAPEMGIQIVAHHLCKM